MTATPPVYPILSVLILAASVLLLCPPTYAQTAGADETRVASSLRNGDNATALQLLGPALRQFPSDAQLWTMQGVAYERQGNKKKALTSFEHALKTAPDTIPALEEAIQILYRDGSPKALPLLERMIRLRPADSTSHGMLAVLEYQQGNCTSATVHFEKAGALFDRNPDALHAYAVCLVRLKKMDKAATVLTRTAELKSGDPRELRVLASVELMAHNPEMAIATLKPLMVSATRDPDTLELASSAYEGIHDTENAVDTLRQAILLQPSNAGLYMDFAVLSAQHESYKVGIDVVNDGLALQPDSASLYFARGMLYAQLANYDKAQADFETAYRLDPDQSLSVAAQGLLSAQQNDLGGALASVQQRLSKKPNDAALLYLKADILSQKGLESGSADFETALRSAKRAVTLNPTLAPAHAVLAKLYLQMADYPEAITECRRSLELNSKDQTSVYRLIQALRKSHRNEEIPGLLKRLAKLREESTNEERERYRYKLLEKDPASP